jgi:hypothetical protein
MWILPLVFQMFEHFGSNFGTIFLMLRTSMLTLSSKVGLVPCIHHTPLKTKFYNKFCIGMKFYDYFKLITCL